MTVSQLTIYGAGLIGGSLALAAKNSGFCKRLVAIDRARPAQKNLEQIFDHWALSEDEQRAALAASDLVVLCVPVQAIIRQLPAILDVCGGTVTDCGSTKAAICHSVADHPKRQQFVAGHPMAGHPEGGLINASQTLFDGRRWILCPEGSSPEAVHTITQLIQATGAELVTLSSEVHDASVAWTSHLPQVVASALSVYAHQNEALQAAGPGFASATRVAGGAEAMWGDIFETNAGAIGHSLVELGKALRELGVELEAGNSQGALQLLAAARGLRNAQNK